jgi:hypothetical protein
LVILFVLLPVSSYLSIRALGVEESFLNIMNVAQTFIPIFSTWWIFCMLKEYIEGDGKELLYIYKKLGKSRLANILLLFTWYCLHIAVLFAGYSVLYGIVVLEYLRIVMQSFLLSGVFYMLTYFLKRTSVSYMFVIIYYLFSLFLGKDESFQYIGVFTMSSVMSIDLLLGKYIFIVCAGILFFTLGGLLDKNYYR